MSKMAYTPLRQKVKLCAIENPPKPITTEQWKKVSYVLRIGGNIEDAAAYAKMGVGRLKRHINSGKAVERDVLKLMSKAKLHHLRRVYDGEKGWQSSAWWLERMYRREYALNLQNLSAEEKAIQIRKIVRKTGPLPVTASPSTGNIDGRENASPRDGAAIQSTSLSEA